MSGILKRTSGHEVSVDTNDEEESAYNEHFKNSSHAVSGLGEYRVPSVRVRPVLRLPPFVTTWLILGINIPVLVGPLSAGSVLYAMGSPEILCNTWPCIVLTLRMPEKSRPALDHLEIPVYIKVS